MKHKSRLLLPILTFLTFGMVTGSIVAETHVKDTVGVEEVNASTDVTNTVGTYVYVEDQAGWSWTSYGNPVHLHMYGFTFDENSGYNDDNLPTGGSGQAAFGQYLSKESKGVYNCKLSGSNNDTHCWVNIPWYIKSFTANFYACGKGHTVWYCEEGNDTYAYTFTRGKDYNFYILGSGSGYGPWWDNNDYPTKFHTKLSTTTTGTNYKYTEKQYTVEIQSNGGEELNDQLILHGGKIVNTPVRPGYTFEKYTSTNDPDDPAVEYVTSDFTAYAHWTEGYSNGIILWKPNRSTYFDGYVYVYYWNDTEATSWPGDKRLSPGLMNVNGTDYYYLVPTFTPKHVIFNDGTDSGAADINYHKTKDLDIDSTALKGSKYFDLKDSKADNDKYGSAWTSLDISMSYHGESGATPSTALPSSYGFGATMTNIPTLSKDGYTFNGWYKESGFSNKITQYGGYSYTSTQDLYAKFTANQYTVNLNKNATDATAGTTSVTATYDSAMPSGKTAPTRPGYDFAGYYKNSNGTGTKYYNANMTSAHIWDVATNSTSIYAKWTARNDTPYTVKHYQQNIVDNNYTLYETENLTGTTDTSVTPAVKSYTGFTAPSTQTVNIDGDGTRVVNYYYTRNIWTLTWNGNGGTVSGGTSGDVKFGASITQPTSKTKEGYTFNSWNTTPASTMPDYDLEYTASWDPNHYTVVYNGNKPAGASGSVTNLPSDGDWEYDRNETLGSAPTLTGYTFGGWYKEAGCSTFVGNAGATLTKPNLTSVADATVNLYAKWTVNTYGVTFDKQSGTGGSDGVTATYDAAMPSASAPSRVNYIFDGYYDEESGDGTKYYTKTMGSARTWNKASATTLYANWTPITIGHSFIISNKFGVQYSIPDDYSNDEIYDTVQITAPKPQYTYVDYETKTYTPVPSGDYGIVNLAVNSAHLTADITFRLLKDEDVVYTETLSLSDMTASIAGSGSYSTDSKDVKALKSSLTYATYSQLYFGVGTSDLANKDISVADKTAILNAMNSTDIPTSSIASPTIVGTPNISITGIAFGSSDGFTLRFKLNFTGDVSNYEAVLNDAPSGVTIKIAYDEARGHYYAYVSGISASNLRTALSITLRNKATSGTYTFSASVGTYCSIVDRTESIKSDTGLYNLCKAVNLLAEIEA